MYLLNMKANSDLGDLGKQYSYYITKYTSRRVRAFSIYQKIPEILVRM